VLEARIAAVARRQHGVVTRRQLFTAGLGESAVDHRLADGQLSAIHRGVYAVGPQRLTRQARWLAAVLACGPGAALSHRHAAAVLQLISKAEGPIEVTASGHGGRKPPRGVRVHRRLLPDAEVTRKDSIPVTTVARIALDLAATGPRRLVERVLDEADYRGLLHPAQLDDALTRFPKRRGARPLRRILREHSIGASLTRSELEELFLALCRARGLPDPMVNAHVNGFEVDFYWRDARVVVEADGYAAHRTRAAFERDRARDLALRAAGYEVLRFSYRQVVERGDWVMTHVSSALGRPTR
jgi:very-short-patch-repair endonuclease